MMQPCAKQLRGATRAKATHASSCACTRATKQTSAAAGQQPQSCGSIHYAGAGLLPHFAIGCPPLREIMKRLVHLLRLLVRWPLQYTPQGVQEGRPPAVAPPMGWSTGFMATPRTCRRAMHVRMLGVVQTGSGVHRARVLELARRQGATRARMLEVVQKLMSFNLRKATEGRVQGAQARLKWC